MGGGRSFILRGAPDPPLQLRLQAENGCASFPFCMFSSCGTIKGWEAGWASLLVLSSLQKPSMPARPRSVVQRLPLPVSQVPRMYQGPPESAHDMAPGLGEHSQLAQWCLLEPTQLVLPKTAPAKTVELNGAASPAQREEE